MEFTEPSEQAYRNFQRHVDRLCLLIVASDCSDREIDIERLHLRVQAAALFPEKMPLYEMVTRAVSAGFDSSFVSGLEDKTSVGVARPRKQKPRCPSCSLHSRGQRSHWMRPSSRWCHHCPRTTPGWTISRWHALMLYHHIQPNSKGLPCYLRLFVTEKVSLLDNRGSLFGYHFLPSGFAGLNPR